MVTFREGKSSHDRSHYLNVWWAEESNSVSVSHSNFHSVSVYLSFSSALPPVCFPFPGSEACNLVSDGPWCPSLQRAISDLSSLGIRVVLLALIELIFQATSYCSSCISQWQSPHFINFSAAFHLKRPFLKRLSKVSLILLAFICFAHIYDFFFFKPSNCL